MLLANAGNSIRVLRDIAPHDHEIHHSILPRKSKVDQVAQGHWLPLRESTFFSRRALDKLANISGDFILRGVNRSGVTTAAIMAGKSTESIST